MGFNVDICGCNMFFMGPDYDARLKEMYTTYSTKDLLIKRNILNILTGSSAADPTPLKIMLVKYITPQVMDAIAVKHKNGQRLWIGTTHLDAKRPVIWNIGLIAASGQPGSLGLIHKIMLASASIPAAFPPVLIKFDCHLSFWRMVSSLLSQGLLLSNLYTPIHSLRVKTTQISLDMRFPKKLNLIILSFNLRPL